MPGCGEGVMRAGKFFVAHIAVDDRVIAAVYRTGWFFAVFFHRRQFGMPGCGNCVIRAGKFFVAYIAVDNGIITAVYRTGRLFAVFFHSGQFGMPGCGEGVMRAREFFIAHIAVDDRVIAAVYRAGRLFAVFFHFFAFAYNVAGALVGVEEVTDIDRAVLLRLPPRGVVEGTEVHAFHTAWQGDGGQVGEGIVGFEVINRLRSFFNDNGGNLRAVFVSVGDKEAFGNQGILTYCQCNAVSVNSRVVEGVILVAEVARDGGGVVNFGKRAAFVEGGVADEGQITQDGKRGHAGTFTECRVADVGDFFGQFYCGKRDAVLEGCVTYSTQAAAVADGFQRAAMAERHVADGGKRLWEGDGGQGRTVVKGVVANGGQAFAKGNGYKSTAFGKGVVCNAFYAVFNREGQKTRASCKGANSNKVHASGNFDGGEGDAVGKAGFLNPLNAGRQFHAGEGGASHKCPRIDVFNGIGQDNAFKGCVVLERIGFYTDNTQTVIERGDFNMGGVPLHALNGIETAVAC